MIEFFSIAFGYFSVFYMLYFLWQGFVYIRIERGLIIKDIRYPVIKQKITILFFHIKAILILAYNQSSADELFSLSTLFMGMIWIGFFLGFSYLWSKIYKNACPLIWNGLFFLTSISTVILIRLTPDLASRQIMWMVVAGIVMCILPFVIKIIGALERLEYLYAGIGLALLLAIFLFGSEEFGSARWIHIGSIGFSPAEIVSFVYILYLSSVFRKKLYFKQLIIPSAVAGIHVVMLVSQRNLGAALILFMCYMIIMYIATGRAVLFFAGMIAFMGGSYLAYQLFSHVQVRVAVWQNPWSDIQGTGFQVIQSLFAIGTGGLFGSGLDMGLPLTVPVVARDMTFAAISEELGVIFSVGMLFVFVMVFYRGVHIALRCKRRFHSLLAVGYTGVIAFQTFLIIGGTMNFIPLTGVTLPFISYGGTSLFVCMQMLAMLQWIHAHNEREVNEYNEEEGLEV